MNDFYVEKFSEICGNEKFIALGENAVTS